MHVWAACVSNGMLTHTQGIPEVVYRASPKGGGARTHIGIFMETHAQLTKMKAYLRNIELAPKQLASWFILICWVVGLDSQTFMLWWWPWWWESNNF